MGEFSREDNVKREDSKTVKRTLVTLLLSVTVISFNLLAQDYSNGGAASGDKDDTQAAAPGGNPVPPPAPTTNNNPPAPDANTTPQSAADRFQALREQRLEEARAYQQEQEEKMRIIEEKRKAKEEARLKAEREKYEDDKEAFLAKFKKGPTPTPTATPSILDQLDEIKAQQAAQDDAELELEGNEAAPSAGQGATAAPAEAEVNLDDY